MSALVSYTFTKAGSIFFGNLLVDTFSPHAVDSQMASLPMGNPIFLTASRFESLEEGNFTYRVSYNARMHDGSYHNAYTDIVTPVSLQPDFITAIQDLIEQNQKDYAKVVILSFVKFD